MTVSSAVPPRSYLGGATMSGGRVFGPTDWPGHDAQGEVIEGQPRPIVKVEGDLKHRTKAGRQVPGALLRPSSAKEVFGVRGSSL